MFFLGCMYYYIKNGEAVFIVLSVLFFGIFIVLMRFHSKLVFQKQIKQALIQINENEIAYLKREKNPFENGVNRYMLNPFAGNVENDYYFRKNIYKLISTACHEIIHSFGHTYHNESYLSAYENLIELCMENLDKLKEICE